MTELELKYGCNHNQKPARIFMEQGELPIKEREELGAADRHTERIMLGLRLREGIPASWLAPAAEPVMADYISRGLLERAGDRLRVTKAGRLLADGIITDLLVAEDIARQNG